tara:strand:- start:211 stop:402 length:192 start_codon:yes stop_codon:yes gene_type:complete
MQLDWPAWSCHVPGEHCVGEAAPDPEKLPSGVVRQSAEELEEEFGLYVPASQGVWAVDPFTST